MTSTQPDQIIHQLDVTSQGFLQATEGLTPEQWNWKPAPDIWSIRETAEHTTVVLRRIARTLTATILSQPLPPTDDRSHASDEVIIQRLFDRTVRRPAPEAVLPTGRWATAAQCTAAYVEGQEQVKEWYTGITDDLRQFGAAHPALGMLDGVQWLLFLTAHTERHTRQMREIQEWAGYPRGRK
ncbi:MAG: DinB family protein [Gemmatimonadales bacterium]